jgi:hypothetical protein
MRALLVSCTLLCAGIAGCGRPQAQAARGAPAITSKPAQINLTDPNITADQAATIIVREAALVPMDYLVVFENRVMTERLWDPVEEGTEASVQTGRLLAQYWQAIRAMPRDGNGEKKIIDSANYFAGDIIDIWRVFDWHSAAMRRDRIGVTPGPLIESATDVMKKSGVKPPGNQPPEEFCRIYRVLRREQRLSHKRAIAELVRSKRFGPGPR